MRKNSYFLVLILWLALAACSPQMAAAPTATAPTAVALTAAAPTDPIPTSTAVEPSAETSAAPTATAATEPSATAVETETTAALNCIAPAELTGEMTEGPYYSAGSPERSSLLEEGMPGTVLTLTGYVLDEACAPIANAWLDFWQADANGEYDNAGYTLRGHLFTAADGSYRLETVVPGEYPGRTEHIHVKIQAPDGPVITSQLYFPGVESNNTDGIFNESNLISVESSSGGTMTASFNFIIRVR